MSKRKDQFRKDGEYHVFNRSVEKAIVFKSWGDYHYFTSRLLQLCKDLNFKLLAWSILPTHYHLFLKQNDTCPVSVLIHRLCTSYAMYFNKKYLRTGHVFEQKFKSRTVGTEEYGMRLRRYINENAVHHGLCEDSAQWPFSSALTFICENRIVQTHDEDEFEVMELSLQE